MGAPVTSRVSIHLLDVIRGEFREMPGMRLTPPQFRRLWGLDESNSQRVIRLLIADGYLARDAAGRLHRAGDE